jgi:hypothetical protein
MKPLNIKRNLASYLKNIKKRKVSIVTAFASGTEELLNSIIKNDNKIDLIIGTINSFSSPKFIDHCLNIENKNFSAFVDFRYENSTHWKLYLVEPNIVILGSANFTNVGVRLSRDTCVVIEDIELHRAYTQEISKLKKSDSVLGLGDSKEFNVQLDKYRLRHRRMQRGLGRSSQCENISKWLENESNQTIPLFIWKDSHSKETIKEAHELIEDKKSSISISDIREFFTYESLENELPYEQGDIVLCTNSTGSYIDFYSFDRIIHRNDMNYMYSYKSKGKQYMRPFKISKETKVAIKESVPMWYDKGLTELTRNELYDLAQKC